MSRAISIAAIALVALAAFGAAAHAATLVPPGNVADAQPAVPKSSANRTTALNTTYERKYRKVLGLLKNDRSLIRDIKATAGKFGIDPIHIVGAIVGEHTYNVDALDAAQTYYLKAVSYLKSDIEFEFDGEAISDFVQRPQFEPCQSIKASAPLWTCRETIWNTKFSGKVVDGKKFPRDRFSAVFFQPFYAGQTFGLGQLNPLTALMGSDAVNRVTGAPKLSADKGKDVYAAIMDPKRTLPYIAATLDQSIDAYRKIAGYDISQNPGLTATLYNTGDPEGRARALAAKNMARKTKGEPPELPQVNYYGWLINDREDELRALLN